MWHQSVPDEFTLFQLQLIAMHAIINEFYSLMNLKIY